MRFSEGNAGDIKPVGEGVFEMRISSGPGYRSYYFYEEEQAVILLYGGDKQSQKRDIKKAKELANELRRQGNE
ncbi:MAG: type II toxin-antitoxin system RelE/ParE family toxin [Planctomycetes bacterium]|nr:type II toxin-antitoxin system RelE/ParE family toxin [Planctomycetota bacterium]